ncbi:MAG: ParA family protein [Rhodospirillales bacterium]|jgi:chromosome partitioning protein|nr:ParA family protein [Rhodospirillales bacterium]
MLSVLVANPKGGCGKTTIATTLAAAFAHMDFVTALADCDRQKSATRWADRRPDHLPAITAVNWTKRVGTVPDGVERLVIDAPAALRRNDVRELIRNADVIVVPVLPSPFDEATSRRFLAVLDKLKPIRKNTRALALIGNRIRARTTAARQLDGFLAASRHDVAARLRDTQAYPTAAAAGMSIFDMTARRIEPLIAEWQPLLRFIVDVAAERGR